MFLFQFMLVGGGKALRCVCLVKGAGWITIGLDRIVQHDEERISLYGGETAWSREGVYLSGEALASSQSRSRSLELWLAYVGGLSGKWRGLLSLPLRPGIKMYVGRSRRIRYT